MKLVMRDNGFCKGLELRREPTEEEIFYCLNEILAFDVDIESTEIDEEVIEQEKNDICHGFIAFLKGDCSWWYLCDILYCYEDKDDFTIGLFAHLLNWLEEKEII